MPGVSFEERLSEGKFKSLTSEEVGDCERAGEGAMPEPLPLNEGDGVAGRYLHVKRRDHIFVAP